MKNKRCSHCQGITMLSSKTSDIEVLVCKDCGRSEIDFFRAERIKKHMELIKLVEDKIGK